MARGWSRQRWIPRPFGYSNNYPEDLFRQSALNRRCRIIDSPLVTTAERVNLLALAGLLENRRFGATEKADYATMQARMRRRGRISEGGLMREPKRAPRPGAASVEAMWATMSVRPESLESPAAASLLDEFRQQYNRGGVFSQEFAIAEDETLDWFVARNRLEEIGFLSWLLRQPDLVAALGEVNTPDIRWRQLPELMFPGHLAATIYAGGSHTGFYDLDAEQRNAKAQELLDAADAMCADLFGRRWTDLFVLHTSQPWSAWFRGIAWDHTWIVVDRSRRRLWVLCATDDD